MDISCPNCSLKTGIVGMEIQGVYDGILYWHCTNCLTNFHRFKPTHHLRPRAVKYITKGYENV